jgi:hypothetical protein
MPTPTALNPTTLNKLKRIFKADADIIDLTERVETLETNFTALSASIGDATGFKITGIGNDPEFTAAGDYSSVLFIDRFSEVGNISIDNPNSVVPAGFSIDNIIIVPEGFGFDIIYDGSQANGSYPITIALIGEEGSTDTITFNVIVNA